jgi:hypothetical protein
MPLYGLPVLLMTCRFPISLKVDLIAIWYAV